jgi:hypothetical protein
MSELQLQVPPPAADASTARRDRALLLGMALVSFATLLLELALTRLFSVVLLYHFAFLAISLALLGLGAGGVFAYVFSQERAPDAPRSALLAFLLARGHILLIVVAVLGAALLLGPRVLDPKLPRVNLLHAAIAFASGLLLAWGALRLLRDFASGALLTTPLRALVARLCWLNAIAMFLLLQIVLRMPVTLDLTARNLLRLSVLYVCAAAPFFLTGLIFSSVFARERGSIPQLYGADLAGGALACLAVVPLLNWFGAPNAIVFAALMMTIAAAVWTESSGTRRYALLGAAALAVIIAFNHSGALIDIVYAKGIRRDASWVEFARWNAISRVEVNHQGGAKVIVIDADASTYIMDSDPANWSDPAFRRQLMSVAPAVVNVLRPQGEYAIIGPGGGVDVLRAVANGGRVTGIEINPIIATDLMRDRYAGFSHGLYLRPDVRIHVAEGRSWVRNAPDRFDVLQMTLVDTWASTAAGAFALSENNLYTVEAFREYFAHLKSDGMLAITRWEFREAREALRVVAVAMEALRTFGFVDFQQHFLIVAERSLDRDGVPVTVLAKRTPFTAAEERAVLAHVAAHDGMHVLYAPSARERNPFSRLIASADPQRFAATYSFNVSPVWDDAPFFFFTMKTAEAVRSTLSGSGSGIDWKNNLGVAVLALVLVLSVLAVLAFLLLPLSLAAGVRRQSIAQLLYFVAVGLGYILVEIAFIQRFILFLGHPTYALTVVVFLMLLASGAGSFVSRRWLGDKPRGRLRLLLFVMVGIVLVQVWFLPQILQSLVGAAFPLKLAVSAALLVPLAFLMGMPFPTGLRAAGDSRGAVEWAWAMNAAASVLGSVAAIAIAIHGGIGAALAAGAVAYAFAAMLTLSRRAWKRA